jgi:hypothetical protein
MSNVNTGEDYQPGDYTSANPIPMSTDFGSTPYTGVPSGYTPPSRMVSGTYSPSYSGITTAAGEQLPFYDITKDAGVFLANLSDTNRTTVLNVLYQKGFYGSSTPGNGLSDKDRSVFADLLWYANTQGVEWFEAFTQLGTKLPDVVQQSGYSRRQYTVSNPSDIKAVVQQTSQQILGRKLMDTEADELVAAYQQQQIAGQRAMGSIVTQAPGADVFTEGEIQQQYAGEADAMQYLSFADQLAQMIGAM